MKLFARFFGCIRMVMSGTIGMQEAIFQKRHLFYLFRFTSTAMLFVC